MGSDVLCGCGADAVGGRTDPDVGSNFQCIEKKISGRKLNITGNYLTLNL